MKTTKKPTATPDPDVGVKRDVAFTDPGIVLTAVAEVRKHLDRLTLTLSGDVAYLDF